MTNENLFMHTIWQPFLDEKGFVLLDGGLATELEGRGYDLNDPLWSARLLIEEPEGISAVHRDYLAAGADVVIAATYQATFQGLMARGLGWEDSAEILTLAINLAVEEVSKLKIENGRSPLIAASIGPYGAYLADGSEYRGDYGLSRSELTEFHRERWQLLAASHADLLACETLPSLVEAEALLDLLHGTPETTAWFSFSCRDELHISDGTPIAECAKLLGGDSQVAAIGINCTRPQFVSGLIDALRKETDKAIVVYPNSGELWDAQAHCWLPGSAESLEQYVSRTTDWLARGATIIGGCCRTTPAHVTAIRQALTV